MAALPGVQTAAWNGTAFAKWVQQARDNYGPSFVAHRIPHRTGARQEQTGNVPLRVVYDLTFAGVRWAQDARAVLGAFVARPRGDLVHHLFGKRRMVVLPIDASWDPVNKGTHYAATVTLEEDSLTNSELFERTPGAVADDTSVASDTADAAAASFVADVFSKFTVQSGIAALRLRTQALTAQVSTSAFTAQIRSYTAAAISQFQAGQLQPSLAAQLGRLPAQLDLTEAAYRVMPMVSPYQEQTIEVSEVALHQAQLLDQAIRANLPPPIRWRVDRLTTLSALVGKLYPSRTRDERFALVDSIAINNALTRPDALTPGLYLVVPAP